MGLDPSDAQRASRQFSGAFASDLGFLRSLAANVAGAFSGNIKSIAGGIPLIGTAAYAASSSLITMGQAATTAATSTASAGAAAAAGGSQLAAMAGPIGIAIAGFLALAAAIGGLIALIWKSSESWAEYGDSIFKAMQKTGQSAEQLSVIKAAAEEVHISFEQVVRGISRYEANVSRGVTNPSRQAAQALVALGLSANKVRDMQPDEAFRTLMTALDGVKNRFDRDRIAADLFGRDFQNLIPVMDKLGKQFDETKLRTEAMGVMFSGRGAAQARQFMTAMRDMRLTATGLAVSFGGQVGPIVSQVMMNIASLVQALGPVIKGIGTLIAWTILGIIIQIQQLVIIVRSIPAQLQLLVANLSTLARAFASLGDTVAAVARGLYSFSTGDYVTAAEMFGQAWTSAQKVGAEAMTQFNANAEEYRAKIQQIIKDVTSVPALPHIEQGDTEVEFPTKGKKEKKQGGEETAERRRLKLLEVDLKTAERIYNDTLDDIRNSFEDHTISMADFVQQSIRAEDALFEARKRVILAELAELETSSLKQEEIDLKTRELQEKAEAAVDEHQRRIAALGRTSDRDMLEQKTAHAQALVSLAEQTQQHIEAMTRRLVERRAISEEEGEKRIIAAQRRVLDLRIAAMDLERVKAGENVAELKKVEDALALLYGERAQLTEDTMARIQDARERDLANERQYQEEIIRLRRENEDREADLDRLEIDNAERGTFDRQLILQERERIERQAEDRRHAREVEDVRRAREANRTRVQSAEQRNRTDAELNRRAEAEDRRHSQEIGRIQSTISRILNVLRRPLSARSIFGDNFANELERTGSKIRAFGAMFAGAVESMRDNVRDMGQIVEGIFVGIQNAVGETVRSYVLYGETGSAVLRKMAAEAIAALAQQAAINAVYYTAQGIVDLFWFPARAAADFAAAATWAGIAGGAAIIGRGVAGDAFKRDQGAGVSAGAGQGSGDSGGKDSGPQIIEAGRAEYNVNINLRLEPGLVADHFVEDWNSDGKTRGTVQADKKR